jgi:hypothetical protein
MDTKPGRDELPLIRALIVRSATDKNEYPKDIRMSRSSSLPGLLHSRSILRSFAVQFGQKRVTVDAQPFFQFLRTITVGTGPRLLTVEVSAILAGVGIFNAKQLEIFFPVGALFGERGSAKTNFNPGHCVIGRNARVLHVPEIFIAGDGTAAQGLFIDRSGKIRFTPRFDPRFY